MNYHDPRGVTLNAGSAKSLERFEIALNSVLGMVGDPEAIIDELLEDDPEFIMGHCLKAILNLLAMERSAHEAAKPSIDTLDALVDGANDLEREHIAAIKTWFAGDLHGAVAHWEKAILLNPRDLLAIRVCHDLAFFLADCRNLRDTVGRVRGQWNRDTPGYGYLLGMHSFGLEECGDYGRAEEAGLQALEINPKDSWAVHAIAHVIEMMGRQEDGIKFMTSREQDWAPDNFFAVHNWWHLALYHLDLGQYDRVFELYDGPIRGDKSNAILDLVDGASMLWRLNLLGLDVGDDRWKEIADAWRAFSRDGVYSFNDLHVMMGLAATGRFAEAEECIKFMEGIVAGPESTNRLAVEGVGLPACRGLLAFGQGHYGEAVDHLLPVRHKAFHFGGSHAQRDLFSWTVIEAMLRDGQYDRARALLNERTELKPSSPQNWLMAGRAFDGLGDEKQAAAARLNAGKYSSDIQ